MAALEELLGDAEEVEVNTDEIKAAMGRQSTDSAEWCNEKWIGRQLRTSNMWRDKRDSQRKRATVRDKEGVPHPKLLTHYRIRRGRLSE